MSSWLRECAVSSLEARIQMERKLITPVERWIFGGDGVYAPRNATTAAVTKHLNTLLKFIV